MQPRSEPLLDALARELERARGVRIPRTAWDVARLPAHLRMTFAVEDERGRGARAGHDLDGAARAGRARGCARS